MEICYNPWQITSIYEFLFFNCPSCNYKVVSSKKQSFVNHAYKVHPESIDHLSDIQDGSISDINPPWQDIKLEINYDEIQEASISSEKTYELHQQNEHQVDRDEHLAIKDKENNASLEYFKEIDEPMDNILTQKSLNRNHKRKQRHLLREELDEQVEGKDQVDKIVNQKVIETSPQKKTYPLVKTESVCEQCGGAFSNKYLLNYHVRRVHDDVRNFPCSYCSKRFKSGKNLRDHVNNIHLNFKAYQCDSCGSTYRTENQLKDHIKTVHNGVKKETFKCESCARTFTRKVGLKLHTDIVHKGIAKITCKTCNVVFQTNSKLKVHIDAVHEKIKKYECNQCGSKFAASYNLRQHIANVHEGRLQFQCQHCLKGFRRRPLLNKHLEIEHGSKT